MNQARGYLTKRANGLYLITAFRPVIHEVVGAGKKDAYFKYGDPMAFINIPPKFILTITNTLLKEHITPYKVCLCGGLQPPTHYLTKVPDFDLYRIIDKWDDSVYVNYICHWFVQKMFNIVELFQPQAIHFSGEIYEFRAKKKS